MKIPQFIPWFGEEEKRSVNSYMSNVGFITEFQLTKEFEQKLAEYMGVKECIVVNNGTVSLTLSSMALGIRPGDSVLIPNYTMIATPNSQHLFGVELIFCDVCPETLCIDLEDAATRIKSNTRALVFVSANGRIAKGGYEAVNSFARSNGLFLIEDAAQSLGSKIDGRNIGTFGDIGSISFSPPKIISTGQGGAVVTNDTDLANEVRKLKDFGRSKGGNDIHDTIGYNFKFTELQASVGLAQLEKIDYRVTRKKEIFELYSDNLKELGKIKLFKNDTNVTAPWFIDCICERRDDLVNYLSSNGIGTRLMYPPINKQKAYSWHSQSEETFKVSEAIGSNGLWLPSSSQLTDTEVVLVCETIKRFYDE